MRLLNSRTLSFREFYEAEVPKYAILSHRWADELSYKDFSKGRRKDCLGYAKITAFCHFACQHGYEWLWIDTVCIDKRSSAELSEAINSMYQWYSNAAICYAYLSDVKVSENSTDEDLLQAFTDSVWFTRGWTLQELLAPRCVVFCSDEWSILGFRGRLDRDFVPEVERWSMDVVLWALTQATGIPGEALRRTRSVRSYSIAQRMSWAAHRKTTRVEDQAYCLLGLFAINMPLLYGEGAKAFKRLQYEIIKASHDETIYAWKKSDIGLRLKATYSILAESPSNFAGAGDVVRAARILRQPWVITHHGLEVPLQADNTIGTIELPGYNLPAPAKNRRTSLIWNDHLNVAIKFPLASRRAGSEQPCEIVIGRLSCGHWGRIYTHSLGEVVPQGLQPITVNFARQNLYIHVDDCEDDHSFYEALS